jgi:hypothetical protein
VILKVHIDRVRMGFEGDLRVVEEIVFEFGLGDLKRDLEAMYRDIGQDEKADLIGIDID